MLRVYRVSTLRRSETRKMPEIEGKVISKGEENAWLIALPGATREPACMHPPCVLAFSRSAHGAADSAIS